MKWIERLKECVDYIEDNLKGEIKIQRLCEIACLSQLYFPRLFEAVTEISLSEYIRRRRMTVAAKELIDDDRKIIDIALDYGYATPESFSRAFKGVHGVSPSALRNDNPTIKSYPKLAFTISIKGDVEMDYKIVEKDAFEVLGLTIRTTDKDGQNHREIPAFWQKVNTDGTSEKLCELTSNPDVVYGICMNLDNDGYFDYAIASPYGGGQTDEFKVMSMPAAKWAIFECVGPMPDSIQKVWKRIFSEWLPATQYEIAQLPQLELYYRGDTTRADYKSEVWIPIKG